MDKVLFDSKKERRALKQYDLVIEPKGRLDYALLVHQLKPQYSIGFGDAGGGAFFDVCLFQGDQNSMTKNRAICETLRIKYLVEIPVLNVPADLKASHMKYSEFVLISPFSSRAEKDWGISRFRELASELQKLGKSFLFCGEKSREKELELLVDTKWEVKLFQPDQLGSWMALVSSVKLVIAPDSAVIHVAVAARVPSIALYSLEDPAIWHPYDANRHRVLRAKEGRMSAITTAQVLECVDGVTT
ncbi:MAG: glycosyltransferase family 9 protein [Candidatus Margulisiibacteriota bacterium]